MVTEKKRKQIFDAFLELASGQDLEDVTMPAVAEKAGVKLSELRQAFDGKTAMIEHFSRIIDAEVLDELDADVDNELPRERLMDVLLSRFDALMPHKAFVRSLMDAARKDVAFAAQLNRVALVSMTWMLSAAKIDTSGIDGAVRVQGTAVVFARVVRIWLDDDESMAKTMAALDKELRQGERTMKRMNRAASLFAPLKRLRTLRRARPPKGAAGEAAS